MQHYGFCNLLKTLSALVVTIGSPASAVDIDKATQRPIDRQFKSDKSMFDIERCLIGSDIRDAASVYRQPDRPNDTLIVYTAMGIVYGLVQLRIGEDRKTDVVIRSLAGLQGPRIRHETLKCADAALSDGN